MPYEDREVIANRLNREACRIFGQVAEIRSTALLLKQRLLEASPSLEDEIQERAYKYKKALAKYERRLASIFTELEGLYGTDDF